MSFSTVPNERDRRLAREEVWQALNRHGSQAANILHMKVQLTFSAERQEIYKLACEIVRRSQQAVIVAPAGTCG